MIEKIFINKIWLKRIQTARRIAIFCRITQAQFSINMLFIVSEYFIECFFQNEITYVIKVNLCGILQVINFYYHHEYS